MKHKVEDLLCLVFAFVGYCCVAHSDKVPPKHFSHRYSRNHHTLKSVTMLASSNVRFIFLSKMD
jgi:hypothetical protein